MSSLLVFFFFFDGPRYILCAANFRGKWFLVYFEDFPKILDMKWK